MLAFGNVFGQSDHARDVTALVPDGKGAIANPAQGTVGLENAILFVVLAQLLLAKGGDDPIAIARCWRSLKVTPIWLKV